MIHPSVQVDIFLQHLSIQHDPSTATITYIPCHKFVQFALRVDVNADSFELH